MASVRKKLILEKHTVVHRAVVYSCLLVNIPHGDIVHQTQLEE